MLPANYYYQHPLCHSLVRSEILLGICLNPAFRQAGTIWVDLKDCADYAPSGKVFTENQSLFFTSINYNFVKF